MHLMLGKPAEINHDPKIGTVIKYEPGSIKLEFLPDKCPVCGAGIYDFRIQNNPRRSERVYYQCLHCLECNGNFKEPKVNHVCETLMTNSKITLQIEVDVSHMKDIDPEEIRKGLMVKHIGYSSLDNNSKVTVRGDIWRHKD